MNQISLKRKSYYVILLTVSSQLAKRTKMDAFDKKYRLNAVSYGMFKENV